MMEVHDGSRRHLSELTECMRSWTQSIRSVFPNAPLEIDDIDDISFAFTCFRIDPNDQRA